jgi:hypothetical protein
MRAIMIAMQLTLCIAAAAAQDFSPERPVLPDQATATVVGCAIIHAYFPGMEVVNPFLSPNCTAELKGDAWVVYRTLPAGMMGGSPTAELSRTDGRVMKIYMTQ